MSDTPTPPAAPTVAPPADTAPSSPSTPESPQAQVLVTPLAAPVAPATPVRQKHNPLHGVTLEAMVTALSEHYGWEELSHLIPIRCFALDPSVASSLKFLRKTPWARDKVEGLYLFMGREQRRSGQR